MLLGTIAQYGQFRISIRCIDASHCDAFSQTVHCKEKPSEDNEKKQRFPRVVDC